MKIAICDDEEVIRNSIAEKLKLHYPDTYLALFSSSEELLESKEIFSIYLLDIEMSGMSGMALAKCIRKNTVRRTPTPVIIFITGYKEHMQDAFDVSAFHYLLKPLNDEKFIAVISRAIEDIKQQLSQMDEYLMIRADNVMRKIAYDDIIYIESHNKQTIFHTTKSNITSYTQMNELEDLLSGRFFRCHRGYLVNLAHVITYEVGEIQVTGGDHILLSRLKYQDFVQAFMRYARTGGITRV